MADPNGHRPDPVHKAQAKAEGVDLSGTVTFRGRQFRLGQVESIAPILDFAEAAAQGLDTDDAQGMAAMKGMIRDVFVQSPSCGQCDECQAERYDACPSFDGGDFPAFWRLVRAVRPTGEELLAVVNTGVEQAMARPTGAPSGSSSPDEMPSANSKAPSSSPEPLPERELPPAFRAAMAAGDLVDARTAAVLQLPG